MVATERDQILDSLNPAQLEAVMTTAGPVLIAAGPGSGKTRVITHRVAHIIKNLKQDPGSVLAMTFTNKAAKEMQERAAQMADQTHLRPRISTFHSFCARILRAHADKVGLKENYSIYDSDEQKSMIRICMEESQLLDYSEKELRREISRSKNNLVTHQETTKLAKAEEDHYLEATAILHEAYDRRLRDNVAVDFDDLLVLTVKLLRENREIRERVQRTYRHIMVDEFQDTNVAQYELTKLLSGGRNVCVVGDPDQAIYSWRGADYRNVEKFIEDHPTCRVIRLGQNYRSTKNIVRKARNLIENNYRPIQNELFTDNPEGAPVQKKVSRNEYAEAEWILSEVRRMETEERRPVSDSAVLYRTNACSRPIEGACVMQGVKYQVVGGTEFYNRKEIRDMTAYLKMIYNPLDTASLNRIINTPPRGLGAQSIKKLNQWATAENMPLHRAIGMISRGETTVERTGLQKKAYASLSQFGQMARRLYDASIEAPVSTLVDIIIRDTDMETHIMKSGEGAEERWENIVAYRNAAQEQSTGADRASLQEFLDHVALMTQADRMGDKEEGITLINIHQAKGLEFPVVFLIGLEQGMLPLKRSMTTNEDLEEERRLCYVAVTRAKEKIYLARCKESRGFQGFQNKDDDTKGYLMEPSTFIMEMFSEEDE